MTSCYSRLPRFLRTAPFHWLAAAFVLFTISGCYLASLRLWTPEAPSPC